MTEDQFAELRPYVDAEAEGLCIDMGYQPSASLIGNGWLREVVRGCWEATPKGREAFSDVLSGCAMLRWPQ